MRITSSMYYDNLYANNNSKINRELFDVNRQISTGLSITYASDDVRTFTETMRLDNEITTLAQIKQSADSGYKVADQTDTVLNDFSDNLNRMKVLLLQASNDTQDQNSRDAIAKELEGIKKNLQQLANTSINGKFLFSGSKVDVKPIDEEGRYHGDDRSLDVMIGSQNKQAYNISGAELFLGENGNTRKSITTNVVNKNLINTSEALTPSSSIRELMGDKDNDENTVNTAYFYIQGVGSDGSAIKDKIALQDNQSVNDLLDAIAKAYGNDQNTQLVDVSMNTSGEIVVQDRQNGSSKLDFHMVGAVDFDVASDENGDGNGDDANVDNLKDLDVGENDYNKIKNGTATSNLYVKEFLLSDLDPARTAAQNIDGLVYDKGVFEKSGSVLQSNIMQIVKDDNSYAQPSTKISEVADLSVGNDGTLDGTVFDLVGKDINGNDYTAQIQLRSEANGGSIFSVDTDGDGSVDTDYNIYDMDPNGRKAVDADEMTYQQLMDVMNMVTTNTLPASSPGSADEYDQAIEDANKKGSVSLDYNATLRFEDKTSSNTQASIAMYDTNSDDFSDLSKKSALTFNANNALRVNDPKLDFFTTIDKVIDSVKNGTNYADASVDRKSIGMEEALDMIDGLSQHVNTVHSKVGAYSNTLSVAVERTQMLEVSATSLRSSVIDTDMAEASLKLQQLDLNYQAMLSLVGKVSKLSLVNYL